MSTTVVVRFYIAAWAFSQTHWFRPDPADPDVSIPACGVKPPDGAELWFPDEPILECRNCQRAMRRRDRLAGTAKVVTRDREQPPASFAETLRTLDHTRLTDEEMSMDEGIRVLNEEVKVLLDHTPDILDVVEKGISLTQPHPPAYDRLVHDIHSHDPALPGECLACDFTAALGRLDRSAGSRGRRQGSGEQ
jgi:hypothetical protein